MKFYITLSILLCFGLNLKAQGTIFRITGTVVEGNSNQGIDYATVAVKDITTQELLTGTTTENGGHFELPVKQKNILVEISFIGFESVIKEEIVFDNHKADLGNISLGGNAVNLDDVIVTAEKSTTEFKLDKRVFNVGTDLSSTGASALEVLNNVPSVNVNIEGQISLRGSSGVQILINGKPSILADNSGNALGTITADMIEKIEVITNPSAKYEAEGTAGIINIVLKKNEKKGINGSVSVNTGAPHNHSVGLSINRRTEKFNLFTQMGVGYRELPHEAEYINQDRQANSVLNSIGEEYRNEKFYNIRLGTDYYINPLNVITLSGSYAYEVEQQPSKTDFEYLENDSLISVWHREEMTEATNPKLQYELQFKRDFEDHKDHQLLFSAIGRFFGKEQSSYFDNEFSVGVNNLNPQETETAFEEGKYTFNLDYSKPFNEIWSIETGAQYLTNNVSNDYEVRDLIEGEYVVNSGLTNLFEYDKKVLGIYGTAAYEGKTWGIKMGLRAENTSLSTLLVNTNQPNIQNFTDFFPSLHTSYKLSEAISFQAGYSRRIYRPRLWDLNPFFNIRNNFNYRTGNPNLLPEYTDSYEVGSIYIFNDLSLNLTAYYRLTTDNIERVSIYENNVTIFRPENIGTNKVKGIETNFKLKATKKITINGDFNYNNFKREGSFSEEIFDFSADQWTGKLTTKIKINKAFDFEISAQHESEEKTVQGTLSPNTFANFGMRYKLLDGKIVFNLGIRDVFASRVHKLTIDHDDYYLFSKRQRGRFITLGFSYGFGKGEAMQYSGRRR